MSAEELKNMSPGDRRIAFTKFLGDAWERILPKPAGEGGFDVESCFDGVCATMTADGMPPGKVPTFQSLKAHKRSHPDYEFTWDEPVIRSEGDDASSDEEDVDDDYNPDDPDDPNYPEEVEEDAGESDGAPDDTMGSGDDDVQPTYTLEEMLTLPLPDSVTVKWTTVTDIEAASLMLNKNPFIAHVFDTGWAVGKLKKKSGKTYHVRYPEGIWEHELPLDMYGKHWHVLEKRK